MLLQTDEAEKYTDHWVDKRHSQYWNDRIRDQSIRTNQELMEAYSREANKASPHNPSHFKTTDMEEEYNGMLLQQGDSSYNAMADPYRDVRMKASSFAPKEKLQPIGYNAFTGEDNKSPAVAHDPEALAQQKSRWTDHWDDKRHSANWNARVRDESFRLNKELNYGAEVMRRKSDPHNPDFYADDVEKDREEEYDGMLLQDGYDGPYNRHSPYYYARENEVE